MSFHYAPSPFDHMLKQAGFCWGRLNGNSFRSQWTSSLDLLLWYDKAPFRILQFSCPSMDKVHLVQYSVPTGLESTIHSLHRLTWKNAAYISSVWLQSGGPLSTINWPCEQDYAKLLFRMCERYRDLLYLLFLTLRIKVCIFPLMLQFFASISD